MDKFEKTVLVFVLKNDQILLVERKDTWFENGLYLVPGGLVDKNETVALAAARELKEETGLTVSPANLVTIGQPNFSEAKGRTLENHYLLARDCTGEVTNLEPNRHSDIGWFTINNLPSNTSKIVTDTIQLIS